MKFLIANEQALFRNGLEMLLKQLDPTAVITQASKFSQTLKMLDSHDKFDLIIIDIDMQDMPWEKGFSEISNHCGDSKLVVMSSVENIHNIKESLNKGAKGYINKKTETKLLSGALKLILDGGIYVPPIMLTKDNEPVSNKNKLLTHRQTEVLNLVAQGLSNKQIAYKIGVSEATVKLHINALLRAIGASNRTQAVIIAQRMGLV